MATLHFGFFFVLLCCYQYVCECYQARLNLPTSKRIIEKLHVDSGEEPDSSKDSLDPSPSWGERLLQESVGTTAVGTTAELNKVNSCDSDLGACLNVYDKHFGAGKCHEIVTAEPNKGSGVKYTCKDHFCPTCGAYAHYCDQECGFCCCQNMKGWVDSDGDACKNYEATCKYGMSTYIDEIYDR